MESSPMYNRARLFPQVDKPYAPEDKDQKVIDIYKEKEQELINTLGLSTARQAIDDAMMALIQEDKHVHNTLLFYTMADNTLVEGHPLDHEGKVQKTLDELFEKLFQEHNIK